jgi:hypothetical protein
MEEGTKEGRGPGWIEVFKLRVYGSTLLQEHTISTLQEGRRKQNAEALARECFLKLL